MRPLLLDEMYALGLFGTLMTIAGLVVALVLGYMLIKMWQPTPTSTGVPQRSSFSIGCSIVLGILLLLVLLFVSSIN